MSATKIFTSDFKEILPGPRKNGAVTIRWRKSSGTWVIYLSGQVLESGFPDSDSALWHLEEEAPDLAKRARIQIWKPFQVGDISLPALVVPLK